MECIYNNREALTIIIAGVGTLLTTIGGIFALLQWKANTTLKRAEIIEQIINKFRSNKDNVSVAQEVEYNKFKYPDNLRTSYFGIDDFESKLDTYLALMDYVCYLSPKKILKEKEFAILHFKIKMTLKNYEIQVYLWNLFIFSRKNSIFCSFENLIEYGLKNKILPIDFKEESCDSYKDRKMLFQ